MRERRALHIAGGACSDSVRAEYLVIHRAAVSRHRAAIDGRSLAVGAGNLALDAALFDRAAGPGRIVYFSSSATYPPHTQDSWP